MQGSSPLARSRLAGWPKSRQSACARDFRPTRRHRGFSLIELLCVMVIIAILASLMLPAIFGAYSRVKRLEAEDISTTLGEEIRHYCVENPNFFFIDKPDLVFKCRLDLRCQEWVNRGSTIFVPFDFLSPTNQTVLTVYFRSGKYHATYNYSKGELAPHR